MDRETCRLESVGLQESNKTEPTLHTQHFLKTEVPSHWVLYWYLLLGQQRHQIRKKLHNKCNVLESFPNHLLPTPGPRKNCLPQNRFLVPKRLGTTSIKGQLISILGFANLTNLLQLLNFAMVAQKQLQTICKPVGVAVLQSDFIYRTGSRWKFGRP